MGKNGFSECSFLSLNGLKCVKKCPKSTIDKSDWLYHQQTAFVSTHWLNGYRGQVRYPKILEFEDDYIIEQLMEGQPLTAQLYDSLPVSEQQKIAADLAELLYFLHQKTYNEDVNESLLLRQWPSISEVFDFFKSHLSSTEIERYLQLEDLCADVSDEYSVWCHSDLKPDHVLYQPDTKQLSVLDFGAAHICNIYHEFFPTKTCAFSFSYGFLYNLLSSYNLNTSSPVNERKVGYLHLLGIWRQIARQGLAQNWEQSEQQQKIAHMKQLLDRVQSNYFTLLD